MVINTSYILQMKLREVQQLAQEHTAHVAAALGSPSQLCRLTPSGCKVLPKLRSAQLTQVCGSPKNAGLSKPRGPFPLYPLGTVLAPHCQIYPLWSPSLEITFCSIQTVGSIPGGFGNDCWAYRSHPMGTSQVTIAQFGISSLLSFDIEFGPF